MLLTTAVATRLEETHCSVRDLRTSLSRGSRPLTLAIGFSDPAGLMWDTHCPSDPYHHFRDFAGEVNNSSSSGIPVVSVRLAAAWAASFSRSRLARWF